MIKHIVLLDLPAAYDQKELQSIMGGLEDLRAKLDGFTGFAHGPNLDFEGMSPRSSYGFICDFQTEVTSRAYIIDPDHSALGARLVALCNGGVNGITVVDLDLTTSAKV